MWILIGAVCPGQGWCSQSTLIHDHPKGTDPVSEQPSTDSQAQESTQQPTQPPQTQQPTQQPVQQPTQTTQRPGPTPGEQLMTQLQALPEQIANAVKEAVGQAKTTPEPQKPSTEDTSKSEGTATASTKTTTPGKKTFSEWWFGG